MDNTEIKEEAGLMIAEANEVQDAQDALAE